MDHTQSEKIATDQAAKKPKIGLALGCGGAPALVHIGVLKALEDHDVHVEAVSGCSMGSYIGALWARGWSAAEMISIAAEFRNKETFKKMADPAVPPIRGLFYGKKFRDHLEAKIGNPNIEDLDRKFIGVAANVANYQRVIFDKGSIISAVHASCAMPGIIVPVNVNGIQCVDGGVVDPVPVGALRDYSEVDKIIAISTTPLLEDIDSAVPVLVKEEEIVSESQDEPWWRSTLDLLGKKYNPAAKGNMVDILRSSLKASQIRIAHDACKRANLAIHAVTEDASWNEYDRYEEFIEAGARATLAVMDEIEALVAS